MSGQEDSSRERGKDEGPRRVLELGSWKYVFLCGPARFVVVLVDGFGALAVGCLVSLLYQRSWGGEDAGADDASGCAWRAVVAVLGNFGGQQYSGCG